MPEFTRGDRLRVSLREADVSVQEMADYLGVSRNAVSRWLNDRTPPGKQTLRLWALRTGVELRWLETGKVPTGMPPGPDRYTTRDSNPEPADLESRPSTATPGRLVPFRRPSAARELAA